MTTADQTKGQCPVVHGSRKQCQCRANLQEPLPKTKNIGKILHSSHVFFQLLCLSVDALCASEQDHTSLYTKWYLASQCNPLKGVLSICISGSSSCMWKRTQLCFIQTSMWLWWRKMGGWLGRLWIQDQ